ncbi:hypothetical protein NX779_01375 [Mycoplasma cottewii]|uniref:Uncharacterized protein n=1 Tax=Mycoplasma cottewii TaxID=51364 RepID=A0ABY5U0E5_9MOLU|nr:hypothetical protein [Mycoplasma cottewii]UWD35271.1 hypothetical protein NX779_01375 [Mycoplasma cottewii]
MKKDYKQMNLEQLNLEKEQLNDQLVQLNQKQKQVNKQIKGKLWLWWFVPIIGMFIYFSFYHNRLSQEKYSDQLVKIKVEIANIELQIMYLDKIINNKLNN